MKRNAMTADLSFRRLRPADAPQLSRLLRSAPPGYSRYFIPFDFAPQSVTAILERAKRDLFFGVEAGGALVGFYMLRGFDEGFRVPAYGVWIAPAFRDCGLASLTLAHAFSICKLNRIEELMLKVHPDNAVPLGLYQRMGFAPSGIDPAHGHCILRKRFKKRAG